MEAGENPSLYDRVGGPLAVRAIVIRLYDLILNDTELAPFFKYTDLVRLQNSQTAFVSYAFGGPVDYHGKNMRSAHAGAVAKGLDDHHFDLVAGYLAQAMQEINMKPELIDEAIATVAATRDDVLNR